MFIFDMAGTTVNENNLVYKTIHKALTDNRYSVSLEEVLNYAGGKEKLQAIKDIITYIGNEGVKAEIVYEHFVKLLDKAYDDAHLTCFDGTEDVFSFLKNNDNLVVLNTGYNFETASKILKKLNWVEKRNFDLLVCADDVLNSRPAPDMILFAMETLNFSDSKKVIKIGDTDIDIIEGKAANCGMSIGVTTGAHTQDQLMQANPERIIHSLEELKNLDY